MCLGGALAGLAIDDVRFRGGVFAGVWKTVQAAEALDETVGLDERGYEALAREIYANLTGGGGNEPVRLGGRRGASEGSEYIVSGGEVVAFPSAHCPGEQGGAAGLCLEAADCLERFLGLFHKKDSAGSARRGRQGVQSGLQVLLIS